MGQGIVISLSCNVTAPVRASALPFSVAPVSIVMDILANMVPSNTEYVPSVAELPTCQKMLAAVAPPLRTIREVLVSVSVLAIWKM